MNLPFTPEQFFAVFARYNESVWPMQIVLNAAAVLCIWLLLVPSARSSRATYLILSLLWAWMAIAYHFVFFSEINPAAWVFGAVFLLGSGAFAWTGFAKADISFRLLPGARAVIGATLIVFALLLYPVISYWMGHHYPNTPTFGLPCPTAIFTLGLLLFSVKPVARWVFVVPLLWAAVGSLAAFQLEVIEDLGLLAAGIATIAAVMLSKAPG